MDTLLLTPAAHSLAEVSLSSVFRRRLPSVYAAVQDGQVDRDALLRLYSAYLPDTQPLLLAGDHTAWPRPKARSLKDRTIEHQPTPVAASGPSRTGRVTAG